MDVKEIIKKLQILAMTPLLDLPQNHVYTKAYISIKSKIENVYLDAILKDLKDLGLVETDHIMGPSGLFSGSGYKLTNEGRKKMHQIKYDERKKEYNFKMIEDEKKESQEKSWINRFFS